MSLRSRSAKRVKDLYRSQVTSSNNALPMTRKTPDPKLIVSKWLSGSSDCKTDGSDGRIIDITEPNVNLEHPTTKITPKERHGGVTENAFDMDELMSTFSSYKGDEHDKPTLSSVPAPAPNPEASLKRLRETAWLASQSVLPTRLQKIREEQEMNEYPNFQETSDPFFKREKRDKRYSASHYESDVSSPDSLIFSKCVAPPDMTVGAPLKLSSEVLETFNSMEESKTTPDPNSTSLDLLERIVNRVERLEMAQSIYTKAPVPTEPDPHRLCSRCEDRKRLESKYKDLKKLHKARVKLCDTLTSAMDVVKEKVAILELENRRLIKECASLRENRNAPSTFQPDTYDDGISNMPQFNNISMDNSEQTGMRGTGPDRNTTPNNFLMNTPKSGPILLDSRSNPLSNPLPNTGYKYEANGLENAKITEQEHVPCASRVERQKKNTETRHTGPSGGHRHQRHKGMQMSSKGSTDTSYKQDKPHKSTTMDVYAKRKTDTSSTNVTQEVNRAASNTDVLEPPPSRSPYVSIPMIPTPPATLSTIQDGQGFVNERMQRIPDKSILESSRIYRSDTSRVIRDNHKVISTDSIKQYNMEQYREPQRLLDRKREIYTMPDRQYRYNYRTDHQPNGYHSSIH